MLGRSGWRAIGRGYLEIMEFENAGQDATGAFKGIAASKFGEKRGGFDADICRLVRAKGAGKTLPARPGSTDTAVPGAGRQDTKRRSARPRHKAG